MKKELKEMNYYINSTREDQCVQIKDLKRGMVWYEVIRQNDINTITEFCCTEQRFKNLYIERR
jgi:myo-inositol-hexaphosphate 3-phosphohydrolase